MARQPMVTNVKPTKLEKYTFPKNFTFGVATSAYQIEGAWNEGGRGESMWDYGLHTNPAFVVDKSNGDVACDSYHKYKEDIKLIKDVGAKFYRFSISWTRIVPLGYKGSKINMEGVKYYNNLIDGLLANGITPYVTIYHWDLPQTLQRDKGGWLNENIVEDYVYYARLLFKHFGDRVKHWITINEFMQFCERGYSNGGAAPFVNLPGVGGYQCSHNALLAHARIYRIYHKEFKPIQNGSVGVSIDSIWCDPLTNSNSDKKASERFMEFSYGWYMNPIFFGNYPPIMRQRIDALSKKQGYVSSRLPYFTPEESGMIRGTYDFIGLNHYSSFLCTFNDTHPQPSFESDSGVQLSQDSKWESSATGWLKYYPVGLRKLLVYIKKKYGNPPVVITENGWANAGVELNDTSRVQYYRGYLSAVLEAIHEDKCNVFGYSAWSMMDNFEWVNGYTLKFGLIHVDFNCPNRTRTPRSSYRYFKNVIKTRRVP